MDLDAQFSSQSRSCSCWPCIKKYPARSFFLSFSLSFSRVHACFLILKNERVKKFFACSSVIVNSSLKYRRRKKNKKKMVLCPQHDLHSCSSFFYISSFLLSCNVYHLMMIINFAGEMNTKEIFTIFRDALYLFDLSIWKSGKSLLSNFLINNTTWNWKLF